MIAQCSRNIHTSIYLTADMLGSSFDLVHAAFDPEEKWKKWQCPCQRRCEQFYTTPHSRDPFAAETCTQIGEGA